jgi:hypothetical protein
VKERAFQRVDPPLPTGTDVASFIVRVGNVHSLGVWEISARATTRAFSGLCLFFWRGAIEDLGRFTRLVGLQSIDDLLGIFQDAMLLFREGSIFGRLDDLVQFAEIDFDLATLRALLSLCCHASYFWAVDFRTSIGLTERQIGAACTFGSPAANKT